MGPIAEEVSEVSVSKTGYRRSRSRERYKALLLDLTHLKSYVEITGVSTLCQGLLPRRNIDIV